MKRWLYNWKTALKFRKLMQYGWCPLCNSSPPAANCPICQGDPAYGSRIGHEKAALWAQKWAYYRRSPKF